MKFKSIAEYLASPYDEELEGPYEDYLSGKEIQFARGALFFDVDGTLVDNNHKPTPLTIRAIQQAQCQGWEPVLCTGRNIGMSTELMEQLGIRYAIYGNGTGIYDKELDKLVYETHIDKSELKQI